MIGNQLFYRLPFHFDRLDLLGQVDLHHFFPCVSRIIFTLFYDLMVLVRLNHGGLHAEGESGALADPI